MSDLVPGVAASLLIQGTIVSHTNLTGDETPRLHPAVQAFLDALPAGLREPFIGYCAESALVSDQLWALDRQRADRGSTSLAEARDHFAGSALVAKKIRAQGDPEHGTPARVCRSCSALLDELGVDVIGS
ncbi:MULTISPECIES: YwqJ-related putative deaminase [unclassified Streptomyces]|uniref:YwqJ-related putative deaminase n=1 Tax=unclassified Streptomyces TaxID=2593676 RepID=UPI002E35C46C|nr:YwqJ-related putative deaminase [Streptomyces sp. NBC_01460]WSS26535.1 YwqJ-related putative deaminase [Streptomyces sp. NBC_01185]